MTRNLLAAAAFSLALASGAAFAQTATEQEAARTGMEPFFTDDSMTAVRPVEENQPTFAALPQAEQDEIRATCDSVMAQGGVTTNETTSSIDPDQLPPAITALCEQVSAW